MCQGQRPHQLPDLPCTPLWAVATARAQVAASNAELAAVRARLAESMAQLERERERARAAELRRWLAESYAERERLRDLLSALVAMRDRVKKRRLRIEEEASRSGPD